MKLTIEITNDELCDIVRDHVRLKVGAKIPGDIAVKIGGAYGYGGATAVIDTDAPAQEPLAGAAE